MKTEQVDKLLKSYKEAGCSLLEEESLMDNINDTDSTEKLWFNFLRSQKRKTPVGIDKQVLSLIEARENLKRRIIIWTSSAAAIALILITSLIIRPGQSEEMNYAEKLALLVEAQNMFPTIEIEQLNKEIIYEDESLIIYIK